MIDKNVEALEDFRHETKNQWPDDLIEANESEKDNMPSDKIKMVKMINNRFEALGDWLAGVITKKEYQDVCWNNRLANRVLNITHPIAISHQSPRIINGKTEWNERTEYVFSENPEIAKKEKENLDYWNETLSYAARNWHFCV